MSTFNMHILDMYMTVYDIHINIHTYIYIYMYNLNLLFFKCSYLFISVFPICRHTPKVRNKTSYEAPSFHAS